MVGYDYRHITMSFTSSLRIRHIQTNCILRQFYVLWQPLLRPSGKGAGKNKRLVKKATSFGFALERAMDSIPNFFAAVNIFN
nr:MAG TPA: hypothetical protein [Caudoviricetes sp.]